MFISCFDLFKLGIGPSSSHTLGPLLAALTFRQQLDDMDLPVTRAELHIKVRLMGSLAHTGKGHYTARGILFGLHGYAPADLLNHNIDALDAELSVATTLDIASSKQVVYMPDESLIYDTDEEDLAHPNSLEFMLIDGEEKVIARSSWCSVGGGFIVSPQDLRADKQALKLLPLETLPYPFDSARSMLEMAQASGLSIAQMKEANELSRIDEEAPEEARCALRHRLMRIWLIMQKSVESGLQTKGVLPGGLQLQRRASKLVSELYVSNQAETDDWLCAYAMAVNEENAAGRLLVTAPTNGAAGVIPAVFYYHCHQGGGHVDQVIDYLLTASAIGGLIKHKSSISGAEVGCQGEVGSASAMAAAGLCAIMGGTPEQVENAAEIALEHHLGMTCDPVQGLVQVPCIERNGFGAIKARAAARLALKGDGKHYISLDRCIVAMRETGMEMSHKYKETALGGLAQNYTEC